MNTTSKAAAMSAVSSENPVNSVHSLTQQRPSTAVPRPATSLASKISALRSNLVRCPTIVLIGWIWLAVMLFVALFAEVLTPYAYTALDLSARLQPPIGFGGQANHLLGTDELGRDVMSRLVTSIQMSLLIAFASTLISAVIGLTLGFLAARFRGWVEQVVMVAIDFQASIPFMLIALAVLAFFGNTLVLFICLMGCHGWERTARITRNLTVAAVEQGYANAVQALGASTWRIYFRHILPNIASTLIVSMTLTFPEVILLESGLSFLGLGVQAPLTSLGNMVGYGREYLQSAPWILLAPAAIIVLTTLSISLVGDWVRDKLDPTLQ